MKTIAIIESCDTKYKEAEFISNFIKKEDLNTLVLNTATGPDPSYNYDISREEIAEAYGTHGQRWSRNQREKRLIS